MSRDKSFAIWYHYVILSVPDCSHAVSREAIYAPDEAWRRDYLYSGWLAKKYQIPTRVPSCCFLCPGVVRC